MSALVAGRFVLGSVAMRADDGSTVETPIDGVSLWRWLASGDVVGTPLVVRHDVLRPWGRIERAEIIDGRLSLLGRTDPTSFASGVAAMVRSLSMRGCSLGLVVDPVDGSLDVVEASLVDDPASVGSFWSWVGEERQTRSPLPTPSTPLDEIAARRPLLANGAWTHRGGACGPRPNG
jgi:hypothetical protein